jgi:hypothetical protein
LKDWWAELTETVDATALLADFGFSSRSAFVSEFFERLLLKIFAGHTGDGGCGHAVLTGV